MKASLNEYRWEHPTSLGASNITLISPEPGLVKVTTTTTPVQQQRKEVLDMLMLSDEEVAERLSIPVESAPCYFPDPQAMVQSMHMSHGNSSG